MRSKMKMVVTTLIVCVALFVTTFAYMHNLNNLLLQENYEYLDEISQQSADAISVKLDSDMRMLRSMSLILGKQNSLDIPFWVESLDNQDIFDQFQRIGIILPNGQGYGQDVSGTDFSDREYFKQAMNGTPYISDVLMDKTTHVLSITYAVPIVYEEQIIGILAAVTHTSTYGEILFPQALMGKGYTYIVKHTGEPVIYSQNEDSNREFDNLFNIIKCKASDKQLMQSNMLQGKRGRLEYFSREKDRLLTYVPLNINDWYIVSIVPKEVVLSTSNSILTLTGLACLAISVLFLSYFISQLMSQQRSKAQLAQLAYYDDLTGLGNKNWFHMTAQKLLEDQQGQYAYCILDIRRFQTVNDQFGYAMGNHLLCQTAEILKRNVSADEVTARFSSDIFHLLLKVKSDAALQERLLLIAHEINNYRFESNSDFRIYTGFGVYVVTDSTLPLSSMGDRANLALQKIKSRRTTECFFFNEDLLNQLLEDRQIENDMQLGIDNREFEIYMQPKHALPSGSIQGAEVLARWLHPTKGLLSPAKFVPLFEKNGFIAELDIYMFESLCQTLRNWLDDGICSVPISINQSRANLYTPGYVDKLSALLDTYRVPSKLITIEITESAFFNDTNTMIAIVDHLHSLGFHISMDDFGSGYSSLSMLQNIILDELKIDKNFFNESADTRRGQKIVQNIIAMALDLNIKIVAEGVETSRQFRFLKKTGCHLVQGYYFSKPMPCCDFEELLRSGL